MNLGRVCGQVVSTKKSENLMGFKILIVQPISLETFEEKGAPVVSIDTIGAGEGEVVMMVSGSSARQTAITDAKPTDNSIVAIIDSVDIGGKRVFDKADPSIKMEKAKEPQREEVPTIDAVLKDSPKAADEAEAMEKLGAEEQAAEAAEESAAAETEEREVQAEPEDAAEGKPEEKEELKLFLEGDAEEKRTAAQDIAVKRARKLIEKKLAEQDENDK